MDRAHDLRAAPRLIDAEIGDDVGHLITAVAKLRVSGGAESGAVNNRTGGNESRGTGSADRPC